MKADLAKNNITIHPYNAIYEDIKNLDTASTVLVDPNRLNYALFNNIPGGTKVVQQVNPTIAMKAKKNDVEIRNIINAHKKDAVAMTKWMYWLKTNIARSRSQSSVLLPNWKHCVRTGRLLMAEL